MKYLGHVEDPDLWELDVLKGGEDDLLPVQWWWSSIVSSPWGGIVTTTLLFWLLSRITRSRRSPALAANLGSFLLFISSMLTSFSVIRELSFRSNVPTLIPTYNTSNQSLITN